MFIKWQSQAEVLSLVPQASVINNYNAFPILPPECGLMDKEQKKHRSQDRKGMWSGEGKKMRNRRKVLTPKPNLCTDTLELESVLVLMRPKVMPFTSACFSLAQVQRKLRLSKQSL